MKLTKITVLALLAFALCASIPAQGQTSDARLYTGGLMASKDNVVQSELFEMSQTQFNLGTARSMSMAGAFTSLGADMASMSINPAGLGMYRNGEVSISPMISITKADNNAASLGKNSKSRFALGNFGVVFKAYEGAGKVVAVNIGVGYNRIADLNYRSSFYQTGNIGSIADMYSTQLNYSGIQAGSIPGGNKIDWYDYASGLWPALLGYKAALTDDPQNRGDWSPTWISSNRYDPVTGDHNIDIGHYSTMQSRGSVGEYAVSVGLNIGNKWYIGATIGLQSLYQRKYYDYGENYYYPTHSSQNPEGYAPDLDYQLLYWQMRQETVVNGTGVNFKLGVTYRPVEALRIGVAFHSPTYMSFSRKYKARIGSLSYANNHTNPNVKPNDNGYILIDPVETYTLEDYGSNEWAFISPARMLVGVSYTIGQRAIIAVDYERTWYNGIRMDDTPDNLSTSSYDDVFRNEFKGSNTIRVGAEFKPLAMLALRAGYGHSGSWLKSRDINFDMPIAKEITYYSAGLGIALSRAVSLDLAYSYQLNKQTEYNLYYSVEEFASGGTAVNSSDYFKTDIKRHTASMTLSFRF